MTIINILVLVGIVVSATVALIVASLQRKQMRQIELYKNDPSVGLVPPSSTLTRFVKAKWDMALGLGAPMIGLALIWLSNMPVTRLSVLLISLCIALLLANIVLSIVFRTIKDVLGLIGRLVDADEKNLSLIEKNLSLIKSNLSLIDRHAGTLKNMVGAKRAPEDGA